MGVREYDPDLGRFIQADTIASGHPQGLNRYTYVENNPTRFVDPSGHKSCYYNDLECLGEQWEAAHGNCKIGHNIVAGSCPPTFWNEEILQEVSEKDPAILDRDDLVFLFEKVNSQPRRLAILDNLSVYLSNSGHDELYILTRLAWLDAKMVNNNAGEFVDDLSMLFLGWHAKDSIWCGLRAGIFSCKDYQSRIAGLLTKGGTGFAPWYQDPPAAVAAGLGTQVFHMWEFVALGYHHGFLISFAGDLFHEFTEYLTGRSGASKADIRLAFLGAAIGVGLKSGILTPLQVAVDLPTLLTAPFGASDDELPFPAPLLP